MEKLNKVLLGLALCSFVFVFASMSGVMAGVCTAQDCSANTTITLGNSAPTITSVVAPASITLNGGTTETIYVEFVATDNNGYANIDFATPSVVLQKVGETSRTGTCVNTANGTLTATFNCSVVMQFYDGAGSWTVNATIADLAAATAENSSQSSTVNALDYITQDTDAVNWVALSAGSNDNEASTFITMTNGGNQDYSDIQVQAYNATGVSLSQVIVAGQFKVNNVVGTSDMTTMVDSTYTSVPILTGLNTHGAAVTQAVHFKVSIPSGTPVDTYNGDALWSIKANP